LMKHSLAAGVALAVSSLDVRRRGHWSMTLALARLGEHIGHSSRRDAACHSSGDGGPAQVATTHDLQSRPGAARRQMWSRAMVVPSSFSVLNPVTATARIWDADVYDRQRNGWSPAGHYLQEATSVHTAGVLDPAQPDFHGTILSSPTSISAFVRSAWPGLSGGATGVSCLSCHQGSGGMQPMVMNPDGTPACAACHASTPASGKHQIHVDGAAGQAVHLFDLPSDHKSAQDHGLALDGSLRTGPAQSRWWLDWPRHAADERARGRRPGMRTANVQQRLLPWRHTPTRRR